MPAQVPNKPTVDFPNIAVIVDTMLVEDTSSYVGNFDPVEPGAPFRSASTHSQAQASLYAGTISLGQRAGKNNEFQTRYWASDPKTQDIHNFNISYGENISGFPGFVRRYLVKRDSYDSVFKGTSLSGFTGCYAVYITNGGSGYSTDPNHPPTIAINDSGIGTGATAICIVDPSTGAISKITLKTEGQFYTPSTVSATITDYGGGSGTGATAEVIVQPTTCLLIDEKVIDAPQPWDALYIVVQRVFKTLPGPIINEVRNYGNSGIPIIISDQEFAADHTFSQLGDYLPSAINVNTIGTGSPASVSIASPIDLPVGAWVTFTGTSTTPSINGTPVQIVAVASDGDTITISPPNPITIGQPSAAGTVQSTNWISRELLKTDNGNVRLLRTTTPFVSNFTGYNENVFCWKNYPFPDYLRGINFYYDKSVSAYKPSGSPQSAHSFSGSVGLDIQPGYRGPCRAYRRLFYFSGSPPDGFASAYTPTIILTSAGTYVVEGGSASTKGIASAGFDQVDVSTSFRTGTIPPVLTGPSPAVTTVRLDANAMNVTGISAGNTSGSPYPIVTVAVNHGLSTGMYVELVGTAYDGTYAIIGVPALNEVEISQNTTLHGAGGTMDVASNAQFGTGSATCTLNLSQSVPAKIIGVLSLTSIGTGSTPTVTTSSAHYLQTGQRVKLTSSGTTNSVDGVWPVTVTGANTFTISPGFSVSGGSSGVGTMQSIITLMEDPQKLGTAALWAVELWDILVPYTSGTGP